MRKRGADHLAKIIIAAAAAATLGGCFHIPARAWANGRELGYGQESMVIYGPHNARATRELTSAIQSSARGWQPVAPSPFDWWGW